MISRIDDDQVANKHPCYFMAIKNWYWAKVPIPCSAVQEKEHSVAFVRKDLIRLPAININTDSQTRFDLNETRQDDLSDEMDNEYSSPISDYNVEETELSHLKGSDNHQQNVELGYQDGDISPVQDSSKEKASINEMLLHDQNVEGNEANLVPQNEDNTDMDEEYFALSYNTDLDEEYIAASLSSDYNVPPQELGSSNQGANDNHQKTLEEEMGHQDANEVADMLPAQESIKEHNDGIDDSLVSQSEESNEKDNHEVSGNHHQSLEVELELQNTLENNNGETVSKLLVHGPVKDATSSKDNIFTSAFLTAEPIHYQQHVRQYETFVLGFYATIIVFFGIALAWRRRYSHEQLTEDNGHSERTEHPVDQVMPTNTESLNADLSLEATSMTPVKLDNIFASTEIEEEAGAAANDNIHRPEAEPTKPTPQRLLLDVESPLVIRQHARETDGRGGVIDSGRKPSKPEHAMSIKAKTGAIKEGLEKESTAKEMTAKPNTSEMDLLFIDTVRVRLALLDDTGHKDNEVVEPDLFKRTIKEWESILPIEITTPYQRNRCHCLIQKLTRMAAVGVVSTKRLLGFVEEWVLSSLASSSNNPLHVKGPKNLSGMVHDLYQMLQSKYELPGPAVITLLPFLIANASIGDICCERRIGQLVFEAASKRGPFYEEKHVASVSSPHPKKVSSTKNTPRKPESVHQGSNQLGSPTTLPSNVIVAEGQKIEQSALGASPALVKDVDRKLLQKIIPKVIEANKATPAKKVSFAEGSATDNRPAQSGSQSSGHVDGSSVHDGSTNPVRPLLLDVEGRERETYDQPDHHSNSRATDSKGPLDVQNSLLNPREHSQETDTPPNEKVDTEENSGGISVKAPVLVSQSDEVEKIKVVYQGNWEEKDPEKLPIHGSNRHQSPRSKSSFLHRERYLRAVMNLKQKVETINS